MILNAFALYPHRNTNTKFVNLRIILCYAIIITLIIFMVMLLVVNDIKNFIDASHLVVVSTTLLCKWSIFITSREKFEHIEEHLNEINETDVPMGMANHVVQEENSRNYLGSLQRFFVLSQLGIGISHCIGLRKFRPLLHVSWSPFDLQNAKYYYSTLAFQSIAFFVNGISNSSMDVMYYVLMDIACVQIDILNYRFEKLDIRKNFELYKDVRKLVMYHCQVIRFIKIIHKIYSTIIFAQCIGSVLVICILGFQLAVTVEFPSIPFIMQSLFMGSMIFQIFGYCWFGHKFSLKSQEVAEACYMSQWNECDIKTKITLLIVMTRAINPIVLNAVTFPLTLQTFTSILKSSYSYMAVLKTMYSDN